MNYRNLLLVLVSVFLLSCDGDDYPYARVPSVILNEFWTQYPDARDAEFKHAAEGYEVDFELSQKDYTTLIDSTGNIVKEKKEIAWNELPSEVQQTLQKEYGQKKIEDIEGVKSTKGTFYQAEVNHFFLDKEIVLNAAGEIEETQHYWK